MFCQKCGKETGNTKFCMHCGAELPQIPAEPVVNRPPTAQPTGYQPIDPVVNEPFAAQPAGEQPTDSYMGELPAVQPPVYQSVEPYASEPPAVQTAYTQPEASYMGGPPFVQMMSMQPGAPQPKKRKTGLIIGIIAAVLAVLAGAAVLLYFTMTFPVEGQWYSEDRGEVLAFGEDGTVAVISMVGTQSEDFSYSRLKGAGSFNIGKSSYDFESDEEEMYIEGLGTYIKADEAFSVESFLGEYGWLGTWYSEGRGEVLVFGTEGALECISLISTQNTVYEYSYLDGSGTLTLDNTSFEISVDNGQLDVSGMGSYTLADESFDSAAFIGEFGQLGTWYCEERGEVLVFDMDGTVKSKHATASNDASFEFDSETKALTLMIGPFTYAGTIEDGQLITEGMGTFTQAGENFNESAFFEDFGGSLLGIWYDKKGELVIDLHDNGTYDAISYGSALKGEYTLRSNGATVYFDILDLDLTEEYSLVAGELVKNSPLIVNAADALIREATEQYGEEDYYSGILGTWAPQNGGATLKFTDETHVTLTIDSTFSGTYTYDPLTGIGFITIEGEVFVFASADNALYFLEVFFYRR